MPVAEAFNRAFAGTPRFFFLRRDESCEWKGLKLQKLIELDEKPKSLGTENNQGRP